MSRRPSPRRGTGKSRGHPVSQRLIKSITVAATVEPAAAGGKSVTMKFKAETPAEALQRLKQLSEALSESAGLKAFN